MNNGKKWEKKIAFGWKFIWKFLIKVMLFIGYLLLAFFFLIFNFRSFPARSKCMVLGYRYALCSSEFTAYLLLYIENSKFSCVYGMLETFFSLFTHSVILVQLLFLLSKRLPIPGWWYSKANFHTINLIDSSFGSDWSCSTITSDKEKPFPCRAPFCVLV